MEECLSQPGAVTVSLVGGYIQVNNNSKCELHIDYLEVEHVITTLVYEPGAEEPSRTAKRRIHERINVNVRIKPGQHVRVYFGPTENIEKVVVVVRGEEGREYRVEAPVIHPEERREQG